MENRCEVVIGHTVPPCDLFCFCKTTEIMLLCRECSENSRRTLGEFKAHTPLT